jgi:hypothetical protein
LTFLASFPPPNLSALFFAFSASTGSSTIFFAVAGVDFFPLLLHTWFPNFFPRASFLDSSVVGVVSPNRFERSIALALSTRGIPNRSARRLRFSSSMANAASASASDFSVVGGDFAAVSAEGFGASSGRLGAAEAVAGATAGLDEVVVVGCGATFASVLAGLLISHV